VHWTRLSVLGPGGWLMADSWWVEPPNL